MNVPKLIARCGKVLPGETEGSLLSKWRRANSHERGLLRARWTHEVKAMAAKAKKEKIERTVRTDENGNSMRRRKA